MKNIKVKFLLLCLGMFLFMTVPAFAASTPIGNTLNSEQYLGLADYLEARGFTAVPEHSNMTHIDTYQSSDGSQLNANMNVILVPFIKDNGQNGRIVYWEGEWDNQYHSGALATIGEKRTLLYDGQKVRRPSNSGELEAYVGIPLYTLSGDTPWGMPTEQIVEVIAEADTVIESEQTAADNGVENTVMSSGCKTVTATRTGYTLLGFTAWKFNMSKYFCYNGTAVTSWNVSTWVSNMDPLFYYRGIINQNDYNITNGHLSMRQGHIQNCVLQYGCIGNYYPAAEIKVYKGGTFSATTWQ